MRPRNLLTNEQAWEQQWLQHFGRGPGPRDWPGETLLGIQVVTSENMPPDVYVVADNGTKIATGAHA